MVAIFVVREHANMSEESICDVFQTFMPSISEGEDLHSVYVLNFLVNTFCSYTAVVLNIITIYAVKEAAADFPKQLKILLLSLALSDLGVGLIVQPFYSTFLVMWLRQKNPNCLSNKAFFVAMSFFAISSFFGVFAISLDRFLAIHLHLRYKQVAIPKRVASLVVSLWIFSGFVAVITVWYPQESSVIVFAIGIVCLSITTMMYIKIYLVFRRHRIHILQTQRVQQSGLSIDGNRGNSNFGKLRKSAVGVFYVYLVFMACYLPRGCNLFLIALTEQSTAMKGFSLFAWTAMLVNSSLNPVIYCLKMKHIRLSVMQILRNILRGRGASPNDQISSSRVEYS